MKLSSAELDQVGRLLNSAEELGATPAEKNALMQDAIDRKLEIQQAKNRARQYLNAVTLEKSQKQIKANIDSWTENGMDKGKAATESFLSFIRGGASRPGQGSNLDPLYLTRSSRAQYLQFFRSALGNEDTRVLQSLEINDTMSRDIYQELNAIENKAQLGQSNNDTALRIAKVIRSTQDFILNDVKGVNPYVEAAKDFLVHRNHDRDLIAATPREQWVKEAQAHFSGSFLGMTPEEKLASFGGIYDDIKSGVYGSTDFDAESFWKPAGASGNQASRSAGSRTLVATDWLNEWQYASKYGDNIWNNMLRQIDAQSRSVGQLQKWGPNAADNFQRLYNTTLRALTDPEQKAAFVQSRDKFKQAFEVTMGSQDNVAHGMLARSAQNLMSLQNAAGLGLHVPRSLNGVQAAITLARDAFGKTYIENAHEMGSGMAKAMLSLDGGREAVQALGGSLQETARDVMGQLMPDEARPGMMARIGEAVGKLSLTDRWVANQKYGIVNLLSRELGARNSVPFEKLPAQTQDMLNRYSLGGDAWEVLKQAVLPEGPLKGRITPESIRALSQEQLAPLMNADTPREAARASGELARNYGVLLNDQAGMTVGESNSRSRIAAYGNTTVNDPWGMARRFMMQFKQAALIRQQLFQRTLQSGGGSTSNIGGVFQYAIGSAFLSMVGEGMIVLATGKSLPAPDSPQMLAHAVRGTGLLGVAGDVLANALSQPKADKQQQVLGSDILGPAFGTISRSVVAAAKTAQGVGQAFQGRDTKDQFGGKYWAQLIHGITPGQNLFYTKAALDYLFMNELHEFMGGQGYLEGLRRSVGKTEGWPEGLGGTGDKQHYTFGGKNFWE